MNYASLEDSNVDNVSVLSTPQQVKNDLPQSAASMRTVQHAREELERILDGEDRRLFAVVGPCSIHHPDAALEYAEKLKSLATAVSDTLFIVMRVYVEKPRSSTGWKGLINDPYLNETFQMDKGIRLARRLLLDVAELGLPAATEWLDTLLPQYIGDLVSLGVIGARTSEAQTHREMASGLSMPIGFKNATDGSLDAALNGMRSAMQAHHFLGLSANGLPASISTTGNAYPHVVLRGGREPNYTAEHIAECVAALARARLPRRIVVDCSHGNSGKNPRRQPFVLNQVVQQLEQGNRSIKGFMLESHLEGGQQAFPLEAHRVNPRCSITDACLEWTATERVLRETHGRLQRLFHAKAPALPRHERTPQ
ncbi:MAG: 3-deoxy-7-phosphoheptulonate synthase [Verrucomicrobiota bacterium]|jgi:3-deoxy-7-phosphoheptulonate synthase|nr:3-deoxy-7-phosphoheptulonate synthase [Verrucomicrobiota bacterium]